MELKLKGSAFRTGRMNAITQLHVGRRVAPFYAMFGIAMAALVKAPKEQQEKLDSDDRIDALGALVPQLAKVFADMKEEDVNYILHACLSVAQRDVGGRWAPLVAPQSQSLALMFDDLDMDDLIALCWTTMEENLQGFSKVLRGLPLTQSTSPTDENEAA